MCRQRDVLARDPLDGVLYLIQPARVRAHVNYGNGKLLKAGYEFEQKRGRSLVAAMDIESAFVIPSEVAGGCNASAGAKRPVSYEGGDRGEILAGSVKTSMLLKKMGFH